MKRIVIILACIFAANCMFQVSAKKVIEKIYYGTKATNDPNNPCSGATTRECYREKVIIDDEDDSIIANSIVTVIGTNADNVIVYKHTYTIPKPAESVIQKILIDVPANAEVTVTTE